MTSYTLFYIITAIPVRIEAATYNYTRRLFLPTGVIAQLDEPKSGIYAKQNVSGNIGITFLFQRYPNPDHLYHVNQAAVKAHKTLW